MKLSVAFLTLFGVLCLGTSIHDGQINPLDLSARDIRDQRPCIDIGSADYVMDFCPSQNQDRPRKGQGINCEFLLRLYSNDINCGTSSSKTCKLLGWLNKVSVTHPKATATVTCTFVYLFLHCDQCTYPFVND